MRTTDGHIAFEQRKRCQVCDGYLGALANKE
jgi:hypothetical protein